MSDTACRVSRSPLVLLGLITGAFFAIGMAFFALNFAGKGVFKPYVSNRFELPFPPLFDEFELDSKSALKSGVNKSRGHAEICRRRVAPEYDSYILGSSGIFEYQPFRRFVVDGDMPPGWLSYTPLDMSALTVIDGCRLDYALYDPTLKADENRAVFTNHLPVFHEYLDNPSLHNRTRIFRFSAPIPTFTVYSLKCLATGETRRGAMLGRMSNAGKLPIDNIAEQLTPNGEQLCIIGDMTYADLFGADRLTISHCSSGFDIYDMLYPDKHAYDHYRDILAKCTANIIHIIAVDHLGHAGKRVSSDMSLYLDDYDIFLRKIIECCSDHKNWMFIALGDHGQKTNGSHGGGSREETDSFLFVLSDLELTTIHNDQCAIDDTPIGYARDHNVLNGRISLSYPVLQSEHINMAVTLCLLMNKPIPYHSGGTMIKDLIPLIKDSHGVVDDELSLKYMAQLMHVVSHQILRAIDASISSYDKQKYNRLYSEIVRHRQTLSHYYMYIRSMGRNNLKLQDRMELYDRYIKQCDRLLSFARKMIEITNMCMTPEYMVSAILLSLLSCSLLTYIILAACRIYHVSHLSSSGVALFEAHKLASVRDIVFCALWKLVLSITLALGCAMHIDYVDELHRHDRILTQRVMSIFKKLIGYFERFSGIDEQPFWFNFVAYMSLLFMVMFLFDLPFIVRGYWLLYHEGTNLDEGTEFPLPSCDFGIHLSSFLSKVPEWDSVWFIGILYVVMVVMTIVSQCAIVSHDILLRHVIIISLYFALFPFVRHVGSLSVDGAYRNFGFLLFVVKMSYLLHPFLVRREMGGMLPAWYVSVQDVMCTFEAASLALTIFYLSLLMLHHRASLPGEGSHLTSPSLELFNSSVSGFFLRFVWTVQYILLQLHYIVKCDRHYFFDAAVSAACRRLTGVRCLITAKTTLGVLSARICLLFTLLVWLMLALNPGDRLYNSKCSPFRRSSIIFWSTVNLIWLSFLLNGPKKAIGVCLFAHTLYNSGVLMLKIRVRAHATFIIMFTYICDLMYFVIGHQDSLFELDFASATLFFKIYNGLPCDIAVFLSFAMCNATSFSYLYYLFLLQFEKRHVSMHCCSGVDPRSLSPGDGDLALPWEECLKRHLDSAMLRTVVLYTCMAFGQITFTISLLYPLTTNICAMTDFYPKGAFNAGKMLVNLVTLWLWCFLV